MAETTAWNHGQAPDIVWQIAGAAHPALFTETPVETLRSQMDTNYWGAAYLAHATMKAWVQPSSAKQQDSTASNGPRQFIMTSSVAALFGIAGLSLLGYEGLEPVDEVYCLPKSTIARVLG